MLILSPFIVQCLFGSGYDESIYILRTMSFLPFIISISNVFGIQIMLNFGYQKVFSKILIFASVIDFLFVIPFAVYLQGFGIAIIMIFVELFVTVCTVGYVYFKVLKGTRTIY